ncbi:MAG: bifunctional riboflavin kinase/FAD synthetase [Cyclobacteriaceae bacterium]|nr:bifunctional riboflavin kinase/FAD synthetase [Cyclobacteriaceae bacterium]
MKIYHSPGDFTRLPFAVVTSGTFDGVHLGHRKILDRVKEVAQRHGGETVVITFWPHPRLVLKPEDQTLKLLNTFEEKAELLKEQGIQHLVRIPFTKEFSQLSSLEFIHKILIDAIGTRKLVIGYDHHFGKNREGSFELLRANAPALGFDVEEIPAQDIDHVTVSSSKIRRALESGDVTTARHFLGRSYSISGLVVKGDKLGRVMGYPTANLAIESHFKLVPADGIYAVRVLHGDRWYGGMLYIGNRPTVNGIKRTIEVNIFDFDSDIYGETLTVTFEQLLRTDSKFRDLEALKQQLHLDKQLALEALKR